MASKVSLVLSFLILFCFKLVSQESIHLFDHDYYFPSGLDNYREQLYGISLAQLSHEDELDETIGLLAKSSFELDETRSIDLLLESIERTNNDEERNDIRLAIGNKYFDRKDFKNASKFYSAIHHSYLEKNNNHEVNFKLGYIHLLDKQFEQSEQFFAKVASSMNPYTKDAQYYLGINQYYLDNVDEAVLTFKQVENHPRYGDLVPYYLSQIYFKQEKYDEVITYGEQRLNQPQLKNRNQILKMLGLSYLAQQQDAKALDYLEQYAQTTSKLTENEFYQLGSLHYRAGNKEKAAEHLKELSHQDTKMGQMANYFLGAISLNQGDKQDARSAFKQSAKNDFYPDVQQESTFLYYKLSSDLGEERTAIKGLTTIGADHPNYSEAQKLLADILLRSNDHKVALETIENLPSKSPELLETYQRLSLDYGRQLMNDGNLPSSLTYLKAAATTPGNAGTKAEAQFWTGYLLDLNGQKSESKQELSSYLASGDRAYAFESNYLLAYQDIEKQDYSSALSKLEKAVVSYDKQGDDKQLYDDAIIRLADLELVNNNYNSALQYYDLAIKNKTQDADYITYQKALIYGVNDQPYEKLTALETLVKDYPKSEYRDDALFEIGESLVGLEKNNEAYKIFESLTELFPRSEYVPKSWMRKGLISYNQGDMETALVAYEKGLKLSDNNEDQRAALLAIEEIYLGELDNPDAYFKFLESEIGYEYEDITKDSITYEVAFTSYSDGDYNQAINLFDGYVKKYKEGFFVDDAYYYLAESHVLLKQYDKALENYETVLSNVGSEHYESALRKAALIAYNHSQDFKKSYSYYDKLITMENSTALELQEAALYSAFISENADGVEKYGLAVVDNPDVKEESKGAAYYYLGKTYESRNKMDEAIAAYTKVSRYLKNNQAAEASYKISQIFYDRKQYDSAEAQAFETTKKAVNYPFYVAKSLLLIGDIYKEKEDYLNASAAYESVVENFKDNQEINVLAKEKLTALNTQIEENSRIKSEEQFELIQLDSLGN